MLELDLAHKIEPEISTTHLTLLAAIPLVAAAGAHELRLAHPAALALLRAGRTAAATAACSGLHRRHRVSAAARLLLMLEQQLLLLLMAVQLQLLVLLMLLLLLQVVVVLVDDQAIGTVVRLVVLLRGKREQRM